MGFLENKKHIHFIGIGGSGMYPLAQILNAKGFFLTGSDNNETDTLKAVRDMGITVYFGQKAENIQGADLIVYSAAIMKDNLELVAAEQSGVATIERSVLLGEISGHFKNAVCVGGTHGKTTATALLTQIFLCAGIDISAVIGGKINIPDMQGSGRVGKTETLILEACEFNDTFLKLLPDIAVVLNIDNDHLDYFGTIENSIKSFTKFCESAHSAIIFNGDDQNSLNAIDKISPEKKLGKKFITFGLNGTSNYYSYKLKAVNGRYNFSIVKDMKRLGEVTLNVPGKHNVYNALAAVAVADFCGLPFEKIKEGIEAFKGAGRRFEKIGEYNNADIYDDYAHHPAELTATLQAAKDLSYQRVIAVFQPFTFSRTALLLEDFVKALNLADVVVLTDIMGGREKNTQNIYTRHLAEKISNCVYFPQDETVPYTPERKEENFNDVINWLKENTKEGDLVITLGCGDANKISKRLVKAD
ncbi:MAG: UDP-N-acetylmuramate--L-alanine ligase [Oscillospiraceae bacterium]|jgi:UDP-N-acetylmuramate--alanine ligase|nr:UDP-N-acetylmuramate--L-alanine ligase [Oscillospiraceae bacterium]